MMNVRQRIVIAWLGVLAVVCGQPMKRDPHIGYLYPAGGQQGTTVKITVGGQNLYGATGVYITGTGITGKVLKRMKPIMQLKAEQRIVTARKLLEVRTKRLKEMGVPSFAIKKMERKIPTPKNIREEDIAKTPLPDHILLDDIDDKSLRELMHIKNIIFFPRMMIQQNRQIGELLLIEVKIASGATPGPRELRLQTKIGLTNPIAFQVGQLPEVTELEPNDNAPDPVLPQLPRLESKLQSKPFKLPILINGQIMPGDVDRFHFTAKEGQHLVVEAHARSLIPYLADAVPGWFQATVALYDDKGDELAYADDYWFNPDPVLMYEIPKTGTYQVEIRDAIYRGREDFVYRLAIGELPFVTRVFPLGAEAGSNTKAEIAGWNLSTSKLAFDTRPGDDPVRYLRPQEGTYVSNPITYAIDRLPECTESEPNNTIADAQKVKLPLIINGRINSPGDLDVFKFEVKKAQSIVAEVFGRRLNSPIDSLVRVTDASGKIITWNDDHVMKLNHLHVDREGLITHHADSYVQAQLPAAGVYYVHLTDVQHAGSNAHAYRLRIALPQPDFLLRVTPSSLHAGRGGMVPITVYASRKDGFNGKIKLRLKSAPPGYRLQGNTIPANADRVRMMLNVSSRSAKEPFPLTFEGTAQIDGHDVTHIAVPADDVMQAFLYRHLVPAKQVLMAVRKSQWAMPPMRLQNHWPVPIPAGSSARIEIRTPPRKMHNDLEPILDGAPKGITLDSFKPTRTGFEFNIKASQDLKPGLTENLIVQLFIKRTPKLKNGKPGKISSWPIGFLPAIPIEVTSR